MDDVKIKQQIVEKIKSSTNILVTVSKDPSVDALSAALGLTLLIDKLDKHPTAVFSGAIPPAITFLEPEKTFENTMDSLRDFIIALDKEKADHLRYKVEGDSVRIFITPYRTTITSNDLEFSQGDFNVELILALGVDNQDHLDSALDAHGQILHDATVITLSAGDQNSTLGSIDWHDGNASSLSEMVTSLADSLKTDKTLLDNQIATAFLTGIVAATDRFSNPHTTSNVMTIAAQLMAAGADQQLIAAKLQESHEINTPSSSNSAEATKTDDNKPSTGGLNISHDPNETLEQMDKRVKTEEQKQATVVATDALDKQTGPTTISSAYALDPTETPLSGAEPTLGGTLNATTDQAAEDARRAADDDQNKTILSHSYLDGSPATSPAMSGATSQEDGPMVDPLQTPVSPEVHSAYALDPTTAPVAAPITPPTPVAPVPPAPADLGLPMPPPLPDFSLSSPTMSSAYALEPTAAQLTEPTPAPERLGDILAPEPPVAVTLTPTPVTSPVVPTPQPTPNDPGQFKIPGQ